MSSLDSMRLRELIRAVRQCKTAAEERALVNKECANIRDGFAEGTPYLRSRNMLKLLYIRMLGYPAEFGQLEVINLLSQQDYSGIRTGYLAMQLLLTEKDEVLILAENHVKRHLSSKVAVRQDKALCMIANIAGEDMSRDVFEDVSPLLRHLNSAPFAALRIVKKAPELAEYFLDKMEAVMSNSTTIDLGSITLVNACLKTEAGQEAIPRFRRLAMRVVQQLKDRVLSSIISPSYIEGVDNPFIQVKFLEFMRIVGKGSSVTSSAFNDCLAQVITNTQGQQNAANAVLYECVRTIEAIESDDDLRTLAINTVSKLLSYTGARNPRSVALRMLVSFAKRDLQTVQHYQNTILECLTDMDVTVRRSALNLTVMLITEENVRLLVPDLLTYLNLCPDDMKEEVCAHLCKIIEQKHPSEDWRVDFSIRLLKVARQYAPEDFAIRLIAVISNQSEEVQQRAVKSLWEEASIAFDALSQSRRAFFITGVWAIGEFSALLLSSSSGPVTAVDVAVCLSDITTNTTHKTLKLYGLTALMKVASRYSEAKDLALTTFASSMTNMDCELQQRASEYTTLLTVCPDDAKFCFAQMPPIRATEVLQEVQPLQTINISAEELQKSTANALDDLFHFDGPKPGSHLPAPASGADDLFTTSSPPAAAPSASTGTVGMDDLFGGAGVISPAAQPARKEVMRCDDFSLQMAAQDRSGAIAAEFVLHSLIPGQAIENLSFIGAVLVSCSLQVSPVPSYIPPQGTASFHVNISDPSLTRKVVLRGKLTYVVSGAPREQQFQVSESV